MSRTGRALNAVSVRGLVKRFDKRVAVNQLSFDVAAGEIFALLGPNGAGKSTTMKILSTLSLPTAGAAYISGLDVVRQAREVRRRIGLVFQEPSLDKQLTLAENLRLHAVMYGVRRRDVEPRVQYALDLIGLTPYRDELASRLSGGMSRRLEIGRALLHKPDVLFLDEPTIGLDPPNRARIWAEVLRLRALTGLTVLMTTHYMDEVEHADRIAIVNSGEVVAIDTPANLKAAVGMDRVQLRTADDRRAVQLLSAEGVSAWSENGGVTVYLPFAERELSFLLSLLDMPVSYVNVQRPTLDDVFLHFTEQSFHGSPVAPRRGAPQRGRAHS
ncbi:MAG: ATP-binding cassette domain-containing protein [Micromonosporaceae bacterium]